MTCQSHGVLIIVFGATGRLGRVLLPILEPGPWSVVAVTRNHKPPNPPSAAHWVQIDVTEPHLSQRSFQSLCDIAKIHNKVIIVDLLLDKGSVKMIRQSLAAGTAYISELSTCLASENLASSLVLASTTAVLAPWLFQTPYGLAKRRQLRHYASTNAVGQVLLLPQLANDTAGTQAASVGLTWTYSDAAVRILRAVKTEKRTESVGLRMVIPPVNRSLPSNPTAHHTSWLRPVVDILKLHVAAWTSHRDAPLAHRLASRGRLELTPRWLRQRIDHHLVPICLVSALGRRLRIEVDEQP